MNYASEQPTKFGQTGLLASKCMNLVFADPFKFSQPKPSSANTDEPCPRAANKVQQIMLIRTKAAEPGPRFPTRVQQIKLF